MNKCRYLFTAILFYCLAFPEFAKAQDLSGVRSMGMGGASVAVTDDPSTALSNPAGLSGTLPASLVWSQTRLSFDSREYLVHGNLSPVSGTAFGVSAHLNQLSQDNVQDFRIALDANGNPVIDPLTNQPQKQILGYYTRYNSQAGLGMGIGIGPTVAAGILVKGGLINSGTDLSQGWGADLGFLLKTGRLSWGAAIGDLGQLPVTLDNGEIGALRPDLRLGASWRLFQTEEKASTAWWKKPLLLAAQVDDRLPWTLLPRLRAGLEWSPARLLQLRVGTDSRRLDFGLSLRIARVQIDYAAVGGDLSQSNRVALRYDF